jgi:hypothetical protein
VSAGSRRSDRRIWSRSAGVGSTAVVLALAGLAFTGGVARAAYPGQNGLLTFESFNSQDTEGGPPDMETDAIGTASTTITECDNNTGPLPCDFGAPSYSPDGAAIVVSRQVHSDPFYGVGGSGSLELIGADGTGADVLMQQTADDEDPAFLPSGSEIVFDGRASPGATRNVYEVATDGSDLSQLTQDGGSDPAPCADGAVAFVRHGNLWLLPGAGGAARRLTRRGMEPNCKPDSKRIAFERGCTLYTIGVNGKDLERVTNRCAASLTYSPDGRYVAFVADVDDPSADGGSVNLDVIDLKSHRVRKVATVASYESDGDSGTDAEGSSAGLSWQPIPG